MKEVPKLKMTSDPRQDERIEGINTKIDIINMDWEATRPRVKHVLLGVLSGIPFGVLVIYISQGWVGLGLLIGAIVAVIMTYAWSGRIF